MVPKEQGMVRLEPEERVLSIGEKDRSTTGRDGDRTSTDGLDNRKLKLMGGFLKERLTDDPFYVAKMFVRVFGANIRRIVLRLSIILALAYLIRHVLVNYTPLPGAYASMILIFLIIMYYTRQESNYASKYLVRFMMLMGADRFLTYHLNKPPGTMIVLLLVGGIIYMTYSGVFKNIMEETRNESHANDR